MHVPRNDLVDQVTDGGALAEAVGTVVSRALRDGCVLEEHNCKDAWVVMFTALLSLERENSHKSQRQVGIRM